MSQVFKSRSSPAKLSERDLGESFRTAVIQNETHHVKALLKKITVDYVLDANRKTALYLASQYGHLKIVKTLLSHEANPNYRCADGSTPLHAACYAASPEIMALLIDAGGDLRLHDNDGRGVKDWALKHIDKKKARAMICYVEELYNRVVETNEDGESQGLSSPQTSSLKKKLRYPMSSKNAVSLQNIGFGRVRRGQFTYPTQRTRLVEVKFHSEEYLRFLKVASWSEEQSTEPSLIPVINETSLVHDHVGITFTNGPFMVMESMYWNQFITVTVKRLRKIPMGQEGGRVDELINENNYMLRLKHAGILLLLAVCPVDRFENVVLIYERVELGSLHMLLHHAGVKFPRRSTCSMFIQICDAVLYLHHNNMIHSYISDHAIMIMSSAHIVKLTNFEYMVDSDANDSSVPVNQTYPAAATKWLAPEILVEKRVSKKTDIYGICVVLWEVLHGKMPFAGLSTAEIEILLTDAQNRVLPIDVSIGTPLNMILDSALKCDPSLRSCKIKDIQNLLEQAYAAVKIDKPIQPYKKQARSSVDPSGVDCTLGCVLYCDQNGDLAELPKAGLIEQPEWHSKVGAGILEQWEPGQIVSGMENAPEVLRRNMRLHKVSAVRKLFKDQSGLDDSSANPVPADEIRRRLLLLHRADLVGGERVATNDDLVVTEGAPHGEVDDLKVDASEKGGRDAALLPTSEGENDFRDERGVTDQQGDSQDDASDTEELEVTDVQSDDEEGDSGAAETKLDTGVSGGTEEKTDSEKVIITNVENRLSFSEKSEEMPTTENAEGGGIISPCKCPLFSAVRNVDDAKNIPSSHSGVDVISTEQLPSFPVSEDFIVPIKIPAKELVCCFGTEEVERIKGDATSAAAAAEGSKPSATEAENLEGASTSVVGDDSRDVERSESTEITVQRVRRSIQLLKRAFFSNNNLSDGTDPVLSSSALIAAQTKKSSSDVSLPTQRLKQLSTNVNRELQLGLKSSKPFATSSSADDQLLPKLSGELTADSMEKFKALINKPLPPLPRTYIMQAQEQRQKSMASSECTTNSESTSPEFDSADWQRLSNTDKGSDIPLLFPRRRQAPTGHYASVTNRVVGPCVPTTASLSGPSEWQPSGPAANLSKQRLRSSNHRVREVVQQKTESPVLYSQVLYAAHAVASKVHDRASLDRNFQSPPSRNVDFMTGFKPASHHVPSMVAPHLSKRTTDCLIPEQSIIPQRMPRRRSLRQEESAAGSHATGYRPENDSQPGARINKVPFSDNDSSSPGDTVKGRPETKTIVDMEELELRNDPFGRCNGIPQAAADSAIPKVFAVSAQTFQARMGSDGPRTAVKSAPVMNGRGAADGGYKTTNEKVEEVMGDHQIPTSKENDPLVSDLEVQDGQHLGVRPPDTEQAASGGPRTLTRLAAMKAGVSLTLPPSVRISELQEEADFMHRFKSDPLLQRDAAMKLGEKSAKGTELDKTSEEATQTQQQQQQQATMDALCVLLILKSETGSLHICISCSGSPPVSTMSKHGNADVEKSNLSEDFAAVSDGDHAKVFKTSAQVCFQMKQPSGSSGSSDSRAKMTKEIEGVSARDDVSCLVESAIRDALDQISREYLISKCPHRANSATAGL